MAAKLVADVDANEDATIYIVVFRRLRPNKATFTDDADTRKINAASSSMKVNRCLLEYRGYCSFRLKVD